jgi:hypothetical protein
LEPVDLLELVEIITLVVPLSLPLLVGQVALLNLELLQQSSAVIAHQLELRPGALVEMATSALGLPVPETVWLRGLVAVAVEQVGQVRPAAVGAIGRVGVG